MIQQNGLLKFDPFNYTGDGVVHGFQAVLLYGYWLWQTTASFLYGAFGFSGVFFLKFLTAILMIWAVLFEMSRQKLSQLTKIVLTGLGTVAIINVYHLERPQVFSVVFMTLLIGMISRIRIATAPTPLLFPMMILWANIHRGFVVGDILLGLAAAGFLIQYRHDDKIRLRLIGWASAGILASFINPNGWTTFSELFNFMANSVGPSNVAEYRSSWQLFHLQSKVSAVSLWGIAALHLGGLWFAPRRFWPEIFISLFIIGFGLAFIRNTGFIAVSLLPVTGWYIEQAYSRWRVTMPRYAQAFICTMLLATISWLTLEEVEGRKALHGPVSNEFPVIMADFLKTSGLSGHLFNDYNSGGYLNWALYPQWKTFIDGRELDTRVSNQYLRIASASEEYSEGKPYYQLMLDRYQIDVVALKIALSDGRLQPLLKRLLENPQWTPVFLDDQSFIIVRASPRNAAAIRQYGLDKNYFLDMMIRIIHNYANRSPDALHLAVLYADILIYSGRVKDAESILKKLETANLNPEVMAYLRSSIKS